MPISLKNVGLTIFMYHKSHMYHAHKSPCRNTHFQGANGDCDTCDTCETSFGSASQISNNHKYRRFTIVYMDSKLIEQARNADMIAFLEKYNGYTFTIKNGSYRCKQHPSLAIKDDRLSFYWHSKGIGGHGVLDYLVKVENMAFRQAVEVVTGTTPTTASMQSHFRTSQPDKPKTLILPEKMGIPLRLYDYLCN